MKKLTIPEVNCADCQHYESSSHKSIMYCNKAKMPMRYEEKRICAFKTELNQTDKK